MRRAHEHTSGAAASLPMMMARVGVPEGRAVELPGRGVTWIHEASGPRGAPVLLLLHGLGATAALNWHAVFEPLARSYRVIALDHCGHGRGLRPRSRFRLADCADDAAALLSMLDVDRAIAVGYSMGGPIAQLLWHRHRHRVAGLVLCATSRNFRGRPRAALTDRLVPALIVPGLALGAELVPAALRRGVLRRILGSRLDGEALDWVASELDGHAPRAVLEAAAAIARFNSAGWIGSVEVPTAVVVTEHDDLVSPAAQRKLAQSIPGATIHPVDGDHAACANRTREFTDALLAACDSVARRGGMRDRFAFAPKVLDRRFIDRIRVIAAINRLAARFRSQSRRMSSGPAPSASAGFSLRLSSRG
jgi:3-oxoadipate enol-lactonase